MAGSTVSKLREDPCLLLSFAVGLLSSAAYPPFYILPALFCGLWLLFRWAGRARSARRAAAYGFLFGFGLNIGGLYWLTHAVLMGGPSFWWAVPLATPGCALILAPFVAVPAIFAHRFPRGWSGGLVFASVWTLTDMSRVFLFSGFPWNPLGADLTLPGGSGVVLTQIVSLIGVDGLTFCLVLTCVVMMRARWSVGALCGLWLLIAASGAYRLHHVTFLPVKNPVVVMVQNNVSEDHILGRDESGEVFERALTLTHEGIGLAKALFPERDAIYAWPESGFPGLLDDDAPARAAIARAADGASGVIGSDRRSAEGKWYNSAMALDGTGHILGVYDKSRLVPFGEYQPALLPFNIMPGQFQVGAGLKTWSFPSFGRVAPLVCYEVVFSGQVVGASRPDWILNLTNDAWFGASAGPWQHLMALRLRAIEEGLPIAQVANTGWTAVFDPTGRETAKISPNTTNILVAPVPSPVKKTFFSIFGRLIPMFICIVAFLIGMVTTRKAGTSNFTEEKPGLSSTLRSRSRRYE